MKLFTLTHNVFVAIFCSTVISFSLTYSSSTFAHEQSHSKDNPRGLVELNWHAEHVASVSTAGYPVSFGLFAFSRRKTTEELIIKDHLGKAKSCLKANFLAFDINDDYAFDINEDVSVELLIDKSQTRSLVYGFDQHGTAVANKKVNFSGAQDDVSLNQENDKNSSDLVWVKLKLNNARFANRGLNNSDFVVTTNETMLLEENLAANTKTTLVLCDLRIARQTQKEERVLGGDELPKANIRFDFVAPSYLTKKGSRFTIQQSDKMPEYTPVRFGIYDSKGSIVLSNSGLSLKYYEDNNQQQSLPAIFPPYQYWPHKNRYFYYSSGQTAQTLAKGSYTLVATKGPEYKIVQQDFTVGTTGKTITVEMERWKDFPELGWYSGDVHIHVERNEKDNQALSSILKAEDVHFSNLLAMSTIEKDHFNQYAYGDKGKYISNDYAIIPGVESPRTTYRGHAIALNVEKVFPNRDAFFLYREQFNYYKKQKSVIGYAHVGSKEFNASGGLALDMPFSVIDFVEVLQNQRLRTEFWYEFLNLGFKLAPAAGSDYPYFDQPGAVRSYVFMPANTKASINKFQTDLWFKQLKKGETFVSNAPYVELLINGRGIGSSLDLDKNEKLNISAKVSVNPDYDLLEKVELVYCGDVIKEITSTSASGSQSLSIDLTVQPKTAGWFAIRTNGVDYTLAHSGAIYLQQPQNGSSDMQNIKNSSACPNKINDVADKMIARLDKLANAKLDVSKELEFWEANKLSQVLTEQRPALLSQIGKAKQFYLSLKNR